MQDDIAGSRASAGIAWNRARSLLGRVSPYLLFGALFACGWRAWDVAHALPYYEDVLEVTWAVKWYDGAARGLHGAAVNPLVFFPTGWQVATFGEGPAMFVLLLPLNWLAGPAFAYNVTLFLTFLLAFVGARMLAARFLASLPALVAALLFTFWGFRWYGYVGHLNILLASALMPWIVLALQRALAATSRRPRLGWLAATGVLWALMVACSWYFVWLGGLLVAGWLAGAAWATRAPVRQFVLNLVVPAAVALVLVAPLLLWFLHGTSQANATFYDIPQISAWDASLNGLAVPSLSHPWLGPLARWIYRGPANEPGQTNFGLLASLLALLGVALAWHRRNWRPVLLIAGLGVLLGLGVVLRWDGQPVQWTALRPLNGLVWQFGHELKPQVFTSARPPAPFDAAVPLPGLLLSAILPMWERARVFARYVLLASTGIFLLAGLALARVQRSWVQYLLAALLLFEVLPGPTQNQPFPLQPHPAFTYLAQQPLTPGEGVIDLGSWQPSLAFMPIGGATLWAADFHGKPTVAGASSVWPAHVAFLDGWLGTHPEPFRDPEFIPILRLYGVHYILFHVNESPARDLLAEARQNPDIKSTRCFDPAAGPGPWDYPICVMELSPAPAFSNMMLRQGWAAAESWGRWIQGPAASVDWVATQAVPHRILIQALPNCIPGQQQVLTVTANGTEVGRHAWSGCEAWSGEVAIPASLVRVGWNNLALRAAYATRPVDPTGAVTGDERPLSVGLTELRVTTDK